MGKSDFYHLVYDPREDYKIGNLTNERDAAIAERDAARAESAEARAELYAARNMLWRLAYGSTPKLDITGSHWYNSCPMCGVGRAQNHKTDCELCIAAGVKNTRELQ